MAFQNTLDRRNRTGNETETLSSGGRRGYAFTHGQRGEILLEVCATGKVKARVGEGASFDVDLHGKGVHCASVREHLIFRADGAPSSQASTMQRELLPSRRQAPS